MMFWGHDGYFGHDDAEGPAAIKQPTHLEC